MKPEFQEPKIISMIKASELHLVPREELTPENLLSAKDKKGFNAYFLASQYVQENQIPPEAYTKKALLSLSPNGQPLICRLLTSTSELPILPAQLTQEILGFRSQENQGTGFHYAASFRALNRIPAKLLTPKNLLSEDKDGMTPLAILIEKQDLAILDQRRSNSEKDFFKDIPINTIRLLSQMGEIKPKHLTGETRKRLLRFQRNQRVIKDQRFIQTPQTPQ